MAGAPKILPQSILTLAESLRLAAGSYRERHEALLRGAWEQESMILNAKQVRELAGGGSQTTAQQAIDAFRASLAASDAKRFAALSGSVPDDVLRRCEELFSLLWQCAQEGAHAQFDEQRAEMEQRIGQLEERLGAQRSDFEERLAKLHESEHALQAQAGALTARLQESIDAHLQSKQQCDGLRQDVASLEAHAKDVQGELERARLEHVDAQSKLQQEVESLQTARNAAELAHKEAVRRVQAQAEQRASQWRSELDALKVEHKVLVAQEAELRIALARAELARQASADTEDQARQRCEALEQQVRSLTQSLAELAASLLQLGSAKREAAQGADPDPTAAAEQGDAPAPHESTRKARKKR